VEQPQGTAVPSSRECERFRAALAVACKAERQDRVLAQIDTGALAPRPNPALSVPLLLLPHADPVLSRSASDHSYRCPGLRSLSIHFDRDFSPQARVSIYLTVPVLGPVG